MPKTPPTPKMGECPKLKGGNVRHSNDNVKAKQEGEIAKKKTNP